MSLEHIFRNINDIRVFDLMSEWIVGYDEVNTVEIDTIMDLLEYPEYKRLEVEDTVGHFVKNSILAVKKIEVDSWTGCKTCNWTDTLGFPRVGKHKQHKPYETSKVYINAYYMLQNDITKFLISAVFAHVFTVDGDEEDETDNNTDKENKKEMGDK